MVKLLWLLPLFFLSCSPKLGPAATNQASTKDMSEKEALPTDHWLTKSQWRTVAEFPWNQADGIAGDLQADVLGFVQGDPKSAKWTSVQLFAAPNGLKVIHSGQEGKIIGSRGNVQASFPLKYSGGTSLTGDQRGNLYILQTGADLSKISPQGELIWTQSSPAYQFEQILAWKGGIWGVQKVDQHLTLRQINLPDGKLTTTAITTAQVTPICPTVDQQLSFMGYDHALGSRIWNWEKDGNVERTEIIPADLHAAFAFPKGMDEAGNVYGAASNNFASFEPGTSKQLQISFDGLVPASDGSIYFSTFDTKTHQITILQKTATESNALLRFTLPQELQQAEQFPLWKLIGVDETGYILTGRNPKTYAYLVKRLGFDGSLETLEISETLGQMGSFAQSPKSWAILPQGGALVPVATPDKLVLLELKF